MTDHLTQLRLDEATSATDVLAPDPLIVRLNMVFSWQQSASRWPYYLSRAVPGQAYTTRELIEHVFADDIRPDQTPNSKVWLRSIYGVVVDREFDEVRIEGIGLFDRSTSDSRKFVITSDGLALAHAYSADRASNDWKRIFADIIARNEPKLRCVLLYLGRWRHLLTFRGGASQGTFFAPQSGGALLDTEGHAHELFDRPVGKSPIYSFTALLQHDQYTILGPFLRERIERAGMRVPEHIVFEGGRGSQEIHPVPTGNGLRPYMEQALSLFRDIGALVYVSHRQGWTLDRERCESLFEPALVADLFGGAPTSRFLDALRVTYSKFSDAEGLVRVADIRDYVCDELDIPTGERIDYFNQQVAYYMRPDVGKLSIGRTFHAQASPSDCLFGDLAQEYVQFIFTSA